MYLTKEDLDRIKEYVLRSSVKDSDFQETDELYGTEYVVITQNNHNRKLTVKDLVKYISKYVFPSVLNITSTYTIDGINLTEALKYIPSHLRKRGLIITFTNEAGDWEIYQFIGGATQWNVESKWKKIS